MAGAAGVAAVTGLTGGWLVVGTVAVNAAIGAGVGALGASVTGQDVGRGALFGAIAGGASAGLGMAAAPAGVNSGGFFAGATAGAEGLTIAGTGEFLAAGTELTATQFTAAGGGAGGVLGTGLGPNISAGQVMIAGGGILASQGEMEVAEGRAAEAEFRAAEKLTVASFNTAALNRDIREFKRKGSALAGARRAVSAASGIRGSTGQALSVTNELEDEIEYQAALIREGGNLETGALLRESEFLTAQRASLLAGGSFARNATLLNTAGELFT
jgi:hypothetical protein